MTALWELTPIGIESVSSVAHAFANVQPAQVDLISNVGRKEFMAASLAVGALRTAERQKPAGPWGNRLPERMPSQAMQIKNSAFAYS